MGLTPCAKLCRPFFVYTYFLFVVCPLPYAIVIPPAYRKLRNRSYLYAINYSDTLQSQDCRVFTLCKTAHHQGYDTMTLPIYRHHGDCFVLYDFTHLLCGKVWNAVTVESFVFCTLDNLVNYMAVEVLRHSLLSRCIP